MWFILGCNILTQKSLVKFTIELVSLYWLVYVVISNICLAQITPNFISYKTSYFPLPYKYINLFLFTSYRELAERNFHFSFFKSKGNSFPQIVEKQKKKKKSKAKLRALIPSDCFCYSPLFFFDCPTFLNYSSHTKTHKVQYTIYFMIC